MPLPTTAETREFSNFSDNGDGSTSRFVKVKGGLGTLLSGVEYDTILATYPSGSTEVFTYKIGGASGSTVATITVTYTDTTKSDFVSVART